MIRSWVRSGFLRLLAFLVVMMPFLMVVAWLVPVISEAHREVTVFQQSVFHVPDVLPHRVPSSLPPRVGVYSGGSSSIVGPPSLTADFIDRVLSAYHSPASGEGQYIYDDGVAFGIDPVFTLAFFMHESSFGRVGVATVSHNPGNIRCIKAAVCREDFAWFPSWAEGFHAWYVLIHDLYVNEWHAVTVEQIIPHYAPAADHNNESGYIHAVMHAVETWRSGLVFVS
jgi:hypothetical protein